MAHPNEQLLRQTDEINRAQREPWTGEGLQQYLQQRDRWEAIWRPFGAALLDAAALQPGERVLDVGCGEGVTTLEAAERVAPGGVVVGVDISAPMLALARQRAAAAGAEGVEYVEADAQAHRFEGRAFDAVISRFGTMFFADPDAAFSNLARALRPGGRLVSVCWQEPTKIEWAAMAIGAAATHLGLPDFGPPGAPGPFALADGARLSRFLEAGGFRDISLETVTRPHRVGDDVDDVVAFITSLDESRALFAGKPEDKIAIAVDAIRAALTPYAGPNGVVMDATAWLVSARR
jgi:SAM-dependent methyltransferase